jgi:peroxiredoxin/sRNA-binding regulator protein Hfq
MNNKSLILIAVAAIINIVFFCGKRPEKGFEIKGQIENMDGPYIYLNWQQGAVIKLDSAVITEGRFKFKGRVEVPSLAVLFVKRIGAVRFYLENGIIEIKGKKDAFSNLQIMGSDTQNEFEAYKTALKDIKGEEEVRTKNAAFILAHPKSYVSVDKLQEISSRMDYKELDKLFKGLDLSLRQSLAGKKLEETVATYKNTAVGSMAPAFTQNDLNGKAISLTDLRGGYVLLDFWASWCVPCRKENPSVLHAYNKFKNKGFTIFAVSLDDNAESWKKAVAEDHLPWMQVSDLKGTDNAAALKYGIFSIPSNFLIDPKGKIIAINLRGDALEKKLAEIFPL